MQGHVTNYHLQVIVCSHFCCCLKKWSHYLKKQVKLSFFTLCLVKKYIYCCNLSSLEFWLSRVTVETYTALMTQCIQDDLDLVEVKHQLLEKRKFENVRTLHTFFFQPSGLNGSWKKFDKKFLSRMKEKKGIDFSLVLYV